MFSNLRSRLFAGVLLLSMSALAADSGIDVAKSTLVATFKQEGVAVDSPFKRFSGKIVYDAKNLAGSSATLDVETGSLDIGDEAYNAEVRKPAWFDSTKYPKATFRSSVIKSEGGKLTATGALTIKGRVLTVNVPINVQKVGAANAYDGTITISRKSFGIGDPVWEDVIDDKVLVKFHLVN